MIFSRSHTYMLKPAGGAVTVTGLPLCSLHIKESYKRVWNQHFKKVEKRLSGAFKKKNWCLVEHVDIIQISFTAIFPNIGAAQSFSSFFSFNFTSFSRSTTYFIFSSLLGLKWHLQSSPPSPHFPSSHPQTNQCRLCFRVFELTKTLDKTIHHWIFKCTLHIWWQKYDVHLQEKLLKKLKSWIFSNYF